VLRRNLTLERDLDTQLYLSRVRSGNINYAGSYTRYFNPDCESPVSLAKRGFVLQATVPGPALGISFELLG